jgi:hypothetical protein
MKMANPYLLKDLAFQALLETAWFSAFVVLLKKFLETQWDKLLAKSVELCNIKIVLGLTLSRWELTIVRTV